MKMRNRYILTLVTLWGTFIALVTLFYLFALKPQMQQVTALETELNDARDLYSQAIEAAKEENQLRLAKTIEKLNKRISDFVLQTELESELAYEIAELAGITQVESFAMKTLNEHGPETLPNCDAIGQKQIKVSFNSQFDQFATLLNAMERHQPTLFVETFAIHRPHSEATQPRVDMQLSVLVETSHSS